MLVIDIGQLKSSELYVKEWLLVTLTALSRTQLLLLVSLQG